MRDENDGCLALLQDAKEILYGIFWLLAGGLLCLIGAVLGGWGVLLLAVGVFLCVGGFVYARHGFHHHEVVEKQDGKELSDERRN